MKTSGSEKVVSIEDRRGNAPQNPWDFGTATFSLFLGIGFWTFPLQRGSCELVEVDFRTSAVLKRSVVRS